MVQKAVRAVFMRGGTSKAVIFRREDLPADKADWDGIFLAALGSPDPSGRQLDGMGGGVSSLSKVCIVGPPSRPDADVDYTFGQVSIRDSVVDYSGNCGNMSSAIGPFAVDEGLVSAPPAGAATVRIHNTNTAKIIVSRFTTAGGQAETEGNLAIDGVAGTGAPVKLEFLDPGGAKTGRLLPTGNPSDLIEVEGMGEVEVSMVDAANPCVFVDAATVGKAGTELPEELEADSACLTKLEAIRRAASVAMGIAPTLEKAAEIRSLPLVAMVTAPKPSPTLSGRQLAARDMSIIIRMISSGQPHRAAPVTGSTCLAVAVRVAGTVPNRIASAGDGAIVIAHPSGTISVDASVRDAANAAAAHAEHGAVFRTARRLFDGRVHYRASTR